MQSQHELTGETLIVGVRGGVSGQLVDETGEVTQPLLGIDTVGGGALVLAASSTLNCDRRS